MCYLIILTLWCCCVGVCIVVTGSYVFSSSQPYIHLKITIKGFLVSNPSPTFGPIYILFCYL